MGSVFSATAWRLQCGLYRIAALVFQGSGIHVLVEYSEIVCLWIWNRLSLCQKDCLQFFTVKLNKKNSVNYKTAGMIGSEDSIAEHNCDKAGGISLAGCSELNQRNVCECVSLL